MPFKMMLALAAAVLMFVVAPIWLVCLLAFGKHRQRSDRPGGGGGISNFVGGSMLELDRFVRPSVEHTIEAEHPVLKREDDKGGE